MNLNQIGGALSGFGAGLTGNGPQFQAGLALRDKRSRALDAERRQAMLTDNRIFLDHMRGGRKGEATELMINRIDGVGQLGGDPADSVERLELMQAGKWDEVLQDAEMTDRAAVLSGELDEFPTAKDDKAQSPTGKLIADRERIGKKYGEDSKQARYLDKKLIEAGVGTSAGEREFNALIEGFTEEEKERARRIKAGLSPRAVGAAPKSVDIGGVEHTFDPITQSYFRAVVDGEPVSAESTGASRGIIAASEKAATQGIEKSGQAMDMLAKVKTGITNIDVAIEALDGGANTGAVAQYFPSFRTASIQLDNARKKMGLDIVGAATFGALSKGELDLALDVGMPSGMNEAGTREWLVSKKAAQEKLSTELTRAAIYLGTPGNTPAGYLEMLRNRDEVPAGTTRLPEQEIQLPPQNNQGWQLMTDAQGNKAYVGPGGEVEEVQ